MNDFETPEQALAALDKAASSMDAYPALSSVAAVQRRAVAFLRERAVGAADQGKRRR